MLVRMRALAIVGLLAAPAAADDRVWDVGAGAPGGITFGVGVRDGGWLARIDAGGAVAPFVLLGTVSLHLHRDVHRSLDTSFAIGASATHLGYVVGSDETSEATVDMIGPSIELRHRAMRRSEVVLEVGAMFGRCRGDCDSRTFVMPAISGHVRF